MTDTLRLGLPLIDAAQAQKHVTHNESLLRLDALAHLSVSARAGSPPASPATGARYLVASPATGAFAARVDRIAVLQEGAWSFLTPNAGWRCWVESEGVLLVHDGAAWRDIATCLHALDQLVHLGIGTTADATNPLSAKLNNALLAGKPVAEGGSGDMRLKLNKEASGNTLSQLYQSNWSGRAETGLIGDDLYRIKVSPDGSAWVTAMTIDPVTGNVGIGSATPGLPFDVTGATSAQIRAHGGAVDLRMAGNGASSTGSLGTFSNHDLTLVRNGAEVGRFDSSNGLSMSGNITSGAKLTTGQGVSTGDSVIELGGSRTGSGNAYIDLHATSGSDYEARILRETGGNGNLKLLNTGAGAIVLDINGGTRFAVEAAVTRPGADNAYTLGSSAFRWSTVYAATGTINTSDAREKTDIADLPAVLPLIRRLRPVSYRWKVGATSFEEIDAPELVREPLTEAVEVERERIDLSEGHAVLRMERHIEQRPVFDTVPVIDEAGHPVLVDGVPRMAQVPRMVEVTRQRRTQRAVERPGRRVHLGLIAQEVKKVADDLGIDFAAYVYDAESDRHGLRYDQMIAPLIKAVQEIAAQQDALGARIAALETKTH